MTEMWWFLLAPHELLFDHGHQANMYDDDVLFISLFLNHVPRAVSVTVQKGTATSNCDKKR